MVEVGAHAVDKGLRIDVTQKRHGIFFGDIKRDDLIARLESHFFPGFCRDYHLPFRADSSGTEEFNTRMREFTHVLHVIHV